ncbi:MAG: dienelactone hydrolase family protein [Novipirellula sp. JB048]
MSFNVESIGYLEPKVRWMTMLRTLAFFVLLLNFAVFTEGADLTFLDREVFQARDTLDIREESSADARACLDGLRWKASEFDVRCAAPLQSKGDALVSFPSPVVSGDSRNDRVTMEWYLARDAANRAATRPAVVVVHESGSKMVAGRVFARGFQSCGLHAFLIHLPYYGQRRGEHQAADRRRVVEAMRQAVADVRRARDAVAALPYVEQDKVSLQGTSLGGFVSATSAGLDSGHDHCGYDKVIILLAGGNLMDVIQSGKRDAARFRAQLEHAGLSLAEIQTQLEQVEPLRVAHRLNPEKTWLYSADYDQVVDIKNALELADGIGLSLNHHIRMIADHYSGIVYLPFVLPQMAQHIRAD